MAGVYIKGMEMPKNCISCPMDQGNYKTEQGAFIQCGKTGEIVRYEEITKSRPRLDHCAIIPVPDHGRLGDLDELESRIKMWMQTNRRAITEDVEPYVTAVLRGIQETVTVIPADRKEKWQ